MKCLNCGKEFTPKCKQQRFCSWQCQYESGVHLKALKRKIEKISEDFGFEVKNQDKITRAKQIILGAQNIMRCPCDAQNPDRYCGSALCIHDVIEFGHCCCNMFHLPEGKEPLCKK